MTISIRLPVLLLLAAMAGAADGTVPPPVATWTLGKGDIAGASATSGAPVALGQRFAAGARQPATLALAAPLSGGLTLSPGAAATMQVETVGEARELVIDLAQGALQIDLKDKGGFSGVRVRGAVLDVRVTGTLFVVERVRRDADYVALVQGKLKAGLRKEVADALGKGHQFDLESRQGVEANSTDGMGTVQDLNNRPQIASASRASVQDQGTGPADGDGGWNEDLALDLLNDLFDQVGLDDALMSEFTDALGEALFDDLIQGPADQVIDTVFSGPGVLGAPPPPPPF
jgi:hypothetical protein